MNVVLCLAALAAVFCAVESKTSPPKVQVYSRNPGEFGKENTLICHVTNFHPPDITIRLLKNGEELSRADQTDLAFKQDWHFHLTKNAAFTPQSGDKYSCRVTHGQKSNDYAWDSDM
ncbi:beta-2-microglobulin-like [Centroberyx gerrardi]|uniref:beta-2-microglobulin-like n=1 Tax=Centroberyx gerrardi TaxID=166262 RepID=UPI003AAA4C47